MDSIVATSRLANFFGEVIAALLIVLLIAKLLEWAFLKRIVNDFATLVWISAMAAPVAVSALWLARGDQTGAFNPNFLIVMFLVAGIVASFRVYRRK